MAENYLNSPELGMSSSLFNFRRTVLLNIGFLVNISFFPSTYFKDTDPCHLTSEAPDEKSALDPPGKSLTFININNVLYQCLTQ